MSHTMNSEQEIQILFHSIIEIYKEDMSILAQITTKNNWNIRTQLGSCMQKIGRALTTYSRSGSALNYFSKLASANVTSISNQITPKIVFFRKLIEKFSEDFFTFFVQNIGSDCF